MVVKICKYSERVLLAGGQTRIPGNRIYINEAHHIKGIPGKILGKSACGREAPRRRVPGEHLGTVYMVEKLTR